ncbi:MAG: hypothetical protein D8B42_03820 [Kingella sp. (in: b-proteobacteria)]|nr:MAG: hypothetical protein D8B42_03820 [Kingella sp. (in: b-proteobacteria)]
MPNQRFGQSQFCCTTCTICGSPPCIRTCIHYFHRHLLCPKNAATALKMLARCPTLLRFLPCIRAFMP